MDRPKLRSLFNDLQASIPLISAPYFNALRDRITSDRLSLTHYFAKLVVNGFKTPKVINDTDRVNFRNYTLLLNAQVGESPNQDLINDISLQVAELIVENARYPIEFKFCTEYGPGGQTFFIYVQY